MPSFTRKVSDLNPRDAQLAVIQQRTRRLYQDRLAVCYADITRAYAAASVIDHLAIVVEEHDRTPSDFRVLSNSEARPLSQFNDASSHWGMYCEQLGRSISVGEREHIFEELQKVPISGSPIPEGNLRFEDILKETWQLIDTGYKPDVVCIPVHLMTTLFKDFSETSRLIDWNSPVGELLNFPGGPSLKIYWSSARTPLDRLVIFDSRRTRWTVKTDPVTGHRLTVAIGEPDSPSNAVMFLAETVAKYEILDVAAIRTTLVEGKPGEDSDATIQWEMSDSVPPPVNLPSPRAEVKSTAPSTFDIVGGSYLKSPIHRRARRLLFAKWAPLEDLGPGYPWRG